jgi:tetratricopeptide (TPR) repeat protein/tRNA A-37 threonylcarbamoyl transferase component Bud32
VPDDVTTHTSPGIKPAEKSPLPESPPGYQLIEKIGQGGMGVVYRARDVALDREVAVKLLSKHYPPDSLPAQRFLSEARITGQLQHPGIPAVHQVGAFADGRPFLAMKLIKGSTLEAILKLRADPSADLGRLLAIFEAICQAVGYAHAHNVIHRDLKPANVMVGAFGEVQVMDWGLAKVLGEETPATADLLAEEQTRAWTQVGPTPELGSHTQDGSMVGTPSFIPPEQALGEIEKINERADVFGLGALLAVILTGQPPYIGETFASVRVQAARGKLQDCFARLDASGAEPELVALCKKCLAFEPADRPADAGAVAQAVAGLRAAAEKRARTAEREQAAAAARSAERRKRRQLVLGAAAALALAVIGGLLAVLAVQAQSHRELEAKNRELDQEQAKVKARNEDLAEQQKEIEARFETAQKAIATFHTGVSEDFLLKNERFKALRTKLLKEAAVFYSELEKLLAGKTDAKSRKLLADGYFQLGELTAKIGDRKEALGAHRKALALRRDLTGAQGADVGTRLDVVRSLQAVSLLLQEMGDRQGGLAAWQEALAIANNLEVESSTDTVRAALAMCYNGVGAMFEKMGRPTEALSNFRNALAIREKLAEANPGVASYQNDLAISYHNMGAHLYRSGRLSDASAAFLTAVNIRQKLLDANPSLTKFRLDLAGSQHGVADVLEKMGKPAEAMAEYKKAQALYRELVDANPAVTEFQRQLSWCDNQIAIMLSHAGKPTEALAAWQNVAGIREKLAEDNPTVTSFQNELESTYANIGVVLAQTGKTAEALAAFQKALTIIQKLADADPANPNHQANLANIHNEMGRLLAKTDRFADAFAFFDKGQTLFDKLLKSEPTHNVYCLGLGESHAFRGWALRKSGRPVEAAVQLRRAVEVWDPVKDREPELLFDRAWALALLAGLGSAGKSDVTTAEVTSSYADQAIAVLRDAISAGWSGPDELKQPDFDALRDRDDFKKLLEELEAKAKKPSAIAPLPGEKK